MNKLITVIISLVLTFLWFTGNAQTKPNIIYILADDMGVGDVGILNRDCKIATPNLDKLAGDGMILTDAHTNSSVCTPTRYGILTGRYAWRTYKKSGVLQGHHNPLIPNSRTTVASYLKTKGYQTACIGKWHLGLEWTSIDGAAVNGSTGENVDVTKEIGDGPLTNGFDYYYGISASLNMPPHAYIDNRILTGNLEYAADKQATKSFGLTGVKPGWVDTNFKQNKVLETFTDKTIKWITNHEKNNTGQPFFVYLPLNAPHSPVVPGDEFLGKSNLAIYGDFCVEVDYRVGQIVNAVNQLGIEENTIIIFTTDNGVSPSAKLDVLESKGHYSSYKYRGLKGSLYEGGHRVPFLVKWPAKVKPGSKSDRLICTTDLLATLTDYYGDKLADNEGEDSYSFLPVLYGKNQTDEIRGGVVHHSDEGIFSIRQGKWKLIFDEGAGTRRTDPKDGPVKGNPASVQLFNMDNDPYEMENLQLRYPEVVKELTLLMKQYVEEGRSTEGAPQQNDKSEKKNWKQIEVFGAIEK